jgi:hypothetical protein
VALLCSAAVLHFFLGVSCLIGVPAHATQSLRSPVETPEKTIALRDAILDDALPVVEAIDLHGLAEEASRMRRWLSANKPPFRADESFSRVFDSGTASFRLSPTLARTLRRVEAWHGLGASSDEPVSHEALSRATLSKASVGRIRDLFEESIRRGIRVDGVWRSPEIGGEALIDGDLRLLETVNPGWALVRELAVHASRPSTLRDISRRHAIEMPALDSHHLLRNALARHERNARGSLVEIQRAVDTLVLNSATTFLHTPQEQVRLIASRDWRGVYVGRWHTHGPRQPDGTWTGADPPSFEDMTNAIEAGQYLTLAFQPDGFDLYDASELADARRVDLSLMRVIRHRSREWREHFAYVFASLP